MKIESKINFPIVSLHNWFMFPIEIKGPNLNFIFSKGSKMQTNNFLSEIQMDLATVHIYAEKVNDR